MECDRRGCENIMCDDLIPHVGYICYECKTELIDAVGLAPTLRTVQAFMATAKLGGNVIVDLNNTDRREQ